MAATLTYREQLIALFAGEMEDGDYVSQPFYSIPLCVKIAEAVQPASKEGLRCAIYGLGRPESAVPDEALEIIKLAYERWRANRPGRSRGL